MDTRMIEVALGLALVFALTSLFVTAVRELWASAWGSRAKVLHLALESFLGDDKIFAEKLMKSPLLVSLSQETKQGVPRPSYMGADIVVTSLVATLVERSTGGLRPSTPLQFVEAVRRKGQVEGGPNEQFLAGMGNLIHGVENDWPGYEARLCAWYDSVTERSIGWFKRSNQRSLLIFGFAVAAAVNVNPIIIATHLWQDAPTRQALASAAEKAGNVYGASIAQAANGTAGGNAETAAAAAAVRAATTAARTELRERRTTEQIATERALDEVKGALEGAKEQLVSHPASGAWQSVSQAYEQVLHLRSRLDAARKADDGSPESLRQKLNAMREMDGAMMKLAQHASGTTPAHPLLKERLAKLNGAVSTERARIAAGLNGAGRHLDCVKSGTDAQTRELCERLSDLNSLRSMGLPVGWTPFLVPEVFSSECVDTAAGDAADACWKGHHLGNLALVIVGWLLTAVATSLGAPFWFDMLSKLAKLRAAGGKPSEADDRGTTTTPPGGTTLSMPARNGKGGGAVGGGPVGVPPGSPPPSSDALNSAEKSLAESEIRRLQRELIRRLHREDLVVNGVLDGSTRDAIRQWQGVRQYTADGVLTERQLFELLNQSGTGVAPPTAPPTAPAPQPAAPASQHQTARTSPAAAPAPDPNFSGAHWIKAFPGSNEIAACEPAFAQALAGFVDALRNAGATVNISATYRPPERAYLMHWSWRIVHDQFDPQRIPPANGVAIDWVHTDAAGVPDLARSRSGAREMVIGYRLVTKPALASRHTERRAVDMTIAWGGELQIRDADGAVRTIIGGPRNGTHPQLRTCGATYGVMKDVFGNDPPHWSDDGH